jgi:hypothetical protein
MSDHDPMCGWEPDVPHADGSVTMTPCRCALIASVRADEREAAAARVAALPVWSFHYYDGIPLVRQADAVNAVRGDSDDVATR